MSEKQNKKLKVWCYDLKSQAEYLKNLADTWNVSLDVLTSNIFANFICTLQEGLILKNMDYQTLAVEYFRMCERTHTLYEKLIKELEKCDKPTK